MRSHAMPKMDGFELYREIRKLDDKVNVFFTTAFDLQLEEFKDRINLPSLSHSFSLAAENNYNSYLKYFIKNLLK
jgi:CheY-like chemotaxis protein